MTNINIGGTSKKKLVTFYRENAIKIAYYLRDGEKTTKELKKLTKIEKSSTYLQKNYYKWFERVDRGIYKLTDLGMKEVEKYSSLFLDLGLIDNE